MGAMDYLNAAASIDCVSLRGEELAQLLQVAGQAVIIDARPYDDYQVEHIRDALSVRLSRLLMRRLSQGKISVEAVVSHGNAWRTRAPDCLVVIYDDDASFAGPTPYDSNKPLHAILRSLQHHGTPCAFLHGGFTAFKAAFPMLLTRTQAQKSDDPFCIKASIAHPAAAAPHLFAQAPPPQQQIHYQHQRPQPLHGHPQSQPHSHQNLVPHQHPFKTAAPLQHPGGQAPPRPPLPQEPYRQSDMASCRLADLAPSKILEYLYLGAQKDATERKELERLHVGFVLNVTDTCPNYFEDSLVYKQIRVKDTWHQNLSSHFEAAFEFIDLARQSDSVIFVHCAAGISRSATVVIAYLMREYAMSCSEAYQFVKARRSIISPNLDFMGELHEFEKRLKMDRLADDVQTMKLKGQQQQQRVFELQQPGMPMSASRHVS